MAVGHDTAETGRDKAQRHVNRLIDESSPYLLQHAYNPVDWHPWGDAAFEKAAREDKPVLLSIGYSTCHWCHVMAHESFEDPHVAELINRVFVPIKVDREERPDIDQVYMTAAHMVIGSGGWPLTVMLMPDRRPFYAATYIPRTSGYGRMGMMELIPRIEQLWRQDRAEIVRSAAGITAALARAIAASAKVGHEAGLADAAYRQLADQFDAEHGGFGRSRKFPQPHKLRFLLRYWSRRADRQALRMVMHTLDAMRRGGIYDQIGSGFHRYATDRAWRLPHFEKMLYDQALISMAYVEAFLASGDLFCAETADEILGYVLRDMTSPEGAFYSAEDADSAGGEGMFYLWRKDEIRGALDPDTARLFERVFDVQDSGNFREEATGAITGNNVLARCQNWSELARACAMSEPELRSRIREAARVLLRARARRERPFRDDKVMTDWNGLMIAAMALAARALGQHRYLAAARQAAGFILGRLRAADGHLLHRYRRGEAGIAATLDDYAFFVWGLLELYEAGFEPGLLQTAVELNRSMLADFTDETSGGLFLTASDAETLLIRPREAVDGATPSGNSVALHNQLRLARMTGAPDLERKARDIMRAFAGSVAVSPGDYAHFMMAVEFVLAESASVVIAGEPEAADTQAMLSALRSRFLPHTAVLLKPGGDDGRRIAELAPFTEHCQMLDGRATAYVCSNFTCRQPTTDVDTMLSSLGEKG